MSNTDAQWNDFVKYGIDEATTSNDHFDRNVKYEELEELDTLEQLASDYEYMEEDLWRELKNTRTHAHARRKGGLHEV